MKTKSRYEVFIYSSLTEFLSKFSHVNKLT